MRFGYFFRSLENLATHSGGIMGRLRANPLNYLLVPFFLLGQLLALIKILRQEQFDTIHAHWIIPQGLAAHMASGLDPQKNPCCLYFQRRRYVCPAGPDIFPAQEKDYSKMPDSDRGQPCPAKRDLKFGAHPDKVKVIPMGVELKKHICA